MATENPQSYELMIIFTPILADDDYKAEQKRFADFIKEHGGEITHLEPWGLRSLAYPIDKKTTGLYWLMEYKAPTDLNEKLEIQMNRSEHIMRHMVTRLDKYAVIYSARRRSKISDNPVTA